MKKTNRIKSKQMKRMIISRLLIAVICFLTSIMAVSCNRNKIFSPTYDETNITSAEVRVGLSHSNKNTEELRKALIEAYKSQDWERVVSCGMAMEENGDSIGNLTILYAEGLCALEMYEKARTLVSDRIKAHPKDQIDYLYKTMGVICYLEDKKDEALAYYKKAIEVNPYYARVFINMAEIYTDQGEKEKAVDNYLKAIDLFYSNKAYDESEFYSKQILEIDNNNIDAYIYLAATYYMKQMPSDYELILDKSKQLGGIAAMKRIDKLINSIK